MTSHMVADTSLDFSHGSGAQFGEIETTDPQRIQRQREPNVSDEKCGECVVVTHIPPIKGTAQVKFKVLEGTEPTLSMTMLVATGNKLVFRGENARLMPLTS